MDGWRPPAPRPADAERCTHAGGAWTARLARGRAAVGLWRVACAGAAPWGAVPPSSCSPVPPPPPPAHPSPAPPPPPLSPQPAPPPARRPMQRTHRRERRCADVAAPGCPRVRVRRFEGLRPAHPRPTDVSAPTLPRMPEARCCSCRPPASSRATCTWVDATRSSTSATWGAGGAVGRGRWVGGGCGWGGCGWEGWVGVGVGVGGGGWRLAVGGWRLAVAVAGAGRKSPTPSNGRPQAAAPRPPGWVVARTCICGCGRWRVRGGGVGGGGRGVHGRRGRVPRPAPCRQWRAPCAAAPSAPRSRLAAARPPPRAPRPRRRAPRPPPPAQPPAPRRSPRAPGRPRCPRPAPPGAATAGRRCGG
jgi:hypothetical protein